jgi:hypothetical protein
VLIVSRPRPRATPAAEAPLLGPGTVIRFGDGSVLDLERDGRGRLAEVTTRGARVVLEEGSLAVRVTPRPDARWLVQAGPCAVKVTGTAFHVDWRSGARTFEIAMSEGHVTVTGPLFEQTLAAGQRLVATVEGGIVSLGPAASAGPAPTPTGNPPGAADPGTPRKAVAVAEAQPLAPARLGTGSPARRRVVAIAETRPPAVDWSRRVAHGEFGSVVADAEQEGIEAALRRTLPEIEALATAARLARRDAVAGQVLRGMRARFPGSEAAHQAAFHLGRLAEDDGHDPRSAVGWYDRYLAESPAGGLLGEALGRRMMALDRLRDGEAAAAARQYLARLPDGPHAASARRILQNR